MPSILAIIQALLPVLVQILSQLGQHPAAPHVADAMSALHLAAATVADDHAADLHGE